ncbi:MAG: two-component sensor histidine kinase [Elusimicrobia bacterium]|nr:two-component sensor histidine kinase [Elusimicrobiota bacterium]
MNPPAPREVADLKKELEIITCSISHDLRAPLRAINGFSQIMAEDYSPALDAEGLRLLGVIRQNAQKMESLIEGLLYFSRLGRMPLAPAALDMRDLAASVIDEIKKSPEGIRTQFRLGELPGAFGDSALIGLVWSRLISNAVKFSAKKDAPLVDVSYEPSEKAYRVKDNGAGFDMKYADKLFGLFQRLHPESEFPGLGADLAMVKRVVRRHGGKVWAEASPRQGASFYFTLPGGRDDA